MSIKNEISERVKAAMKAREEIRLSTLRLLLSDIKYFEIANGREATDADFSKLVATAVKKRSESVEQYRSAGRDELAAKEEAEIAVLKEFLPEQMGKAEIARIVTEVTATLGVSGPQAIGRVMKAVMARVAGKADGKLVSEIVKKSLAS